MSNNNNEEGSFSKGMKVTFGVIFALFFLGVVIPCATCGGCAMLGGVSEGIKEAEDRQAKEKAGVDPDTPDLEVVDLNYKVTQKNRVFYKYAYQFTLKNHTSRTQSTNAEIIMTDADGYEVDKSVEYGVEVPAGSEKTVKGSTMIQLPEAKNVAGMEVK